MGEDGTALVELWLEIPIDPLRRPDRLRASELLADRGLGKAPAFQPIEVDSPLGLEDLQASAEEFEGYVWTRLDPERHHALACLESWPSLGEVLATHHQVDPAPGPRLLRPST